MVCQMYFLECFNTVLCSLVITVFVNYQVMLDLKLTAGRLASIYYFLTTARKPVSVI